MAIQKKKNTATKKRAVSASRQTISGKKKFILSSKQKKIIFVLTILLVTVGGYVGYSLYQKSLSDAISSPSNNACRLSGSNTALYKNVGFYNGKTRLSGAGVKIVYDKNNKYSYCIMAWSSKGKPIISETPLGAKSSSATAKWKMVGIAMMDTFKAYYRQSNYYATSKTQGAKFTYDIKYSGKIYSADTGVLSRR